MNKKRTLILSAVLILIGGTSMRWAWFLMQYNWSVVIILGGAAFFLSGVVLFAFTIFNKRNRY